jgi:hypothetical protein
MSNALIRFNKTAGNALVTAQSVKDTMDRIDASKRQKQNERETLSNMQVNLIFAIDATASRMKCWREATLIQSSMFFAATQVGPHMNAQLVSYSGLTMQGDLARSSWLSDASSLSGEMDRIKCKSGYTQIEKVFKHAMEEHTRRPIHGLILIGDSCEEEEAALVKLAQKLKNQNTRFFLFDDANNSTARRDDTFTIFRRITEAAEGAYEPLGQNSADVLGDYLKAAVIFSTGNQTAMDMLDEVVKTPQGQRFVLERRKLMLAAPVRK